MPRSARVCGQRVTVVLTSDHDTERWGARATGGPFRRVRAWGRRWYPLATVTGAGESETPLATVTGLGDTDTALGPTIPSVEGWRSLGMGSALFLKRNGVADTNGVVGLMLESPRMG